MTDNQICDQDQQITSIADAVVKLKELRESSASEVLVQMSSNRSLVRNCTSSSEGALYQNSFGPLFRYESGTVVSGTVVAHVGAPVACGPRIIDTALATPLL
ncbi:hypothetical protein TNCV_3716051 [Trichonephila clavipes]|nr:hypothetical protein TNCV_3716051 [Trichonephila clavipes]